ncbi:hypothetical protein CCACVL1_06306 [Corchorus capsularis]|uniref:Uncharacterized protein n=1 Tax=Corchorus capsularis TaxID=210143 RepID=A0A1R3JGC7_COCAP|nr:hypothetical protein CCACVL1_06306 [Corchorus capsularis]
MIKQSSPAAVEVGRGRQAKETNVGKIEPEGEPDSPSDRGLTDSTTGHDRFKRPVRSDSVNTGRN